MELLASMKRTHVQPGVVTYRASPWLITNVDSGCQLWAGMKAGAQCVCLVNNHWDDCAPVCGWLSQFRDLHPSKRAEIVVIGFIALIPQFMRGCGPCSQRIEVDNKAKTVAEEHAQEVAALDLPLPWAPPPMLGSPRTGLVLGAVCRCAWGPLALRPSPALGLGCRLAPPSGCGVPPWRLLPLSWVSRGCRPGASAVLGCRCAPCPGVPLALGCRLAPLSLAPCGWAAGSLPLLGLVPRGVSAGGRGGLGCRRCPCPCPLLWSLALGSCVLPPARPPPGWGRGAAWCLPPVLPGGLVPPPGCSLRSAAVVGGVGVGGVWSRVQRNRVW